MLYQLIIIDIAGFAHSATRFSLIFPYEYLIPKSWENFANPLSVGRLVDGTFEWEELGSMAVLHQPGTK